MNRENAFKFAAFLRNRTHNPVVVIDYAAPVDDIGGIRFCRSTGKPYSPPQSGIKVVEIELFESASWTTIEALRQIAECGRRPMSIEALYALKQQYPEFSRYPIVALESYWLKPGYDEIVAVLYQDRVDFSSGSGGIWTGAALFGTVLPDGDD